MSSAAREVLTTGLWVLMAEATFVFFLNGLLWASVFEYYFPDFGGNLVAYAGSSLSLIVGTMYSSFLDKMMRDYLAGPRSYVELLVRIGNVGDSIAGVMGLPGEGEGSRIARDAKNDAAARARLQNVRCALRIVAFYAYRIFSPENHDSLGREAIEPTVTVESANRFGAARAASRVDRRYRIAHLPSELEGVAADGAYLPPIALIHEMRGFVARQLTELQALGVDPALMQLVILGDLVPALESVTGIEASSLVQEPAIFGAHAEALFVFYFFFWFPVSTWAAVGWTATVLSYPLVAMIFLGPGVYRAWIGNPFDPARQAIVADTASARRRYAVDEMRTLAFE
jgi:hypothetical protein